MSNTAIFWPVLLQVAVTLTIFVLMFRARASLVKKGDSKVSDFYTYENESSESRKWSRAVTNQFETPVLFYAICIMAFVTGNVDGTMLTLAWVYSLIKTAHVYIHVTTNRLKHRMRVFFAAFFVLLIQLIWFAIKLAS